MAKFAKYVFLGQCRWKPCGHASEPLANSLEIYFDGFSKGNSVANSYRAA